jgi:hypothetical protein
MPTPTFTFVHVVWSLVGIGSGFVVIVVLALFIVLSIVAEKRFHSEPVRTA